MKNWKQHKYSSASECMSKLWYIHTTEYYLNHKKLTIDTDNMSKSQNNERSLTKKTHTTQQYALYDFFYILEDTS